jgi:hypothetical protein
MGASYLRPEFYDCFIKNICTLPNKHNLLAVFEKLLFFKAQRTKFFRARGQICYVESSLQLIQRVKDF